MPFLLLKRLSTFVKRWCEKCLPALLNPNRLILQHSVEEYSRVCVWGGCFVWGCAWMCGCMYSCVCSHLEILVSETVNSVKVNETRMQLNYTLTAKLIKTEDCMERK